MVIIDEENPGQQLSERAYDTRVAGIVSGASSINPGISLHQEGLLETGQNVALSGRVYVKPTLPPSRSNRAICLLPPIRGHAMKVTDHCRAQVPSSASR